MPAAYTTDRNRIIATASLLSICSFLYYYRSGQFLLYGDAVAHMVIARRVFDSLTPGLTQLGTVWLPLPHILMMPFLASDWSWHTGAGGSIPNMFAYVAAVVGIFRLASAHLDRTFSWFAAAIFALNPNLLYMQSVAMTESLYLAAIIWVIVYLDEFRARVNSEGENLYTPLIKCSIALSAAMLTRYDGWFLDAICAIAVIVTVLGARNPRSAKLIKPVAIFILLCAIAPSAWLIYNWRVYNNPLEFYNGPYSARAISQKMSASGEIMHPGWRDPREARAWYNQSARDNMGPGYWGHIFFWPALIVTVLACFAPRYRTFAILWTPVVFYTLSIAYGGVPIFVPEWYSGAYVNVRYGTQLLPAISLGFAMAIYFVLESTALRSRKKEVIALAAALVLASYISAWIKLPICVQEAIANGKSKTAVEVALADYLKQLPLNARLLMFCGEHPGALMRAGIPLKHIVNENNWPFWNDALVAPAAHADYIIAFDGDPVDIAVHSHPEDLLKLAVIHTPGKNQANLYRSQIKSIAR